jgi:hypothetical protein
MKRAFYLVVGGLVFGMAAVSACGGTSTNPAAAAADSGTDAAVDTGVPDTGRDAKPLDGATCDLSTDFTKTLPDASFDAGEAGAGITPAVCVACLDKNCATEKAGCNANCECKGVVAEVLDCVNKGNPIISCGGPILNMSAEGQAAGTPLVGCIQNKCRTECVPPALQDASIGDAATGG